MKKHYFLKTGLLILILFSSTNIFSQTVFDLTTVTDNTPTNVSETINGVTMTVSTKNNGSNNTLFVASSGFGTNGIAAHGSSSQNNEEMTISFSQAVDISNIIVNSTQFQPRTWTFTPTGGSNSIVTETNTFNGSTTVTLNFINITQIVITSDFLSSNAEQMIFDSITIPETLSIEDSHFNKSIILFPNPSANFIKISGLSNQINYKIYDVIGTVIKTGSVSNNEEIDIRNFTNGLYFLRFENRNTFKFLKD